MEARYKIRALASLLGGALMLGAAAAGAMAADLGQLPAPFVENGNLKGQIVVGANAAVDDVIAAAQIAAAFGEFLVKGGSAEATVATGAGYQDEYSVVDTVSKTLTPALYGELLKFDKISFYGKDGDNHEVSYTEKLIVNGNIERGTDLLTTISDEYKDEAAKVFFAPAAEGIKYVIEFKDDDISSATVDKDHPATINLLGRELKIVGVGNGEITVRTGTPKTLSVGESATVEGVTIEVEGVYKSGSDYVATVKINGQEFTLGKNDKETVNGIEVLVDDILIPWDASAGQPSVKFLVGTSTEETYKDGDAYFGEDEDHPIWVWHIQTSSSAPYVLDEIGVKNKLTMNDLKSDYANEQPIPLGQMLKIAGSNIEVGLKDFKVKDTVKYTVYSDGDEIRIRSSWDYGINDQTDYVSELILKFNESEASKVWIIHKDPTTGDEVAELKDYADYRYTTGTGDYALGAGHWYLTLGDNEKDVEIKVHYDNGTVSVTQVIFDFTDTAVEDLKFPIYRSGGDVYLGNAENDDEQEVIIGSENFGSKDYDYMTKYGAIVKAGKDVDDLVEIEIPKAKQEVIFYAGKEGAMTATATAEVVKSAITSEVAVLDTEYATGVPLVVVGGPAVNKVAEQILGSRETSYEQWKEFFGVDETGEGKGVIKLYDADETSLGVPVLLVAGWEAKDTRAAAYVLAKYLTEGKISEWAGKTKVTVAATSATSITSVEAE